MRQQNQSVRERFVEELQPASSGQTLRSQTSGPGALEDWAINQQVLQRTQEVQPGLSSVLLRSDTLLLLDQTFWSGLHIST